MNHDDFPPQPTVSNGAALEGLERLVLFLMNEVAAAQPSPVAYVQASRIGVIDGASEAQGEHARQVAEYMHWMMAMCGVSMRRRVA